MSNNSTNHVTFRSACYALFAWECGWRRYGYKIQLFIWTKQNGKRAKNYELYGLIRFEKESYGTLDNVMAIVMVVRCNAMHIMRCWAFATLHMWICINAPGDYSRIQSECSLLSSSFRFSFHRFFLLVSSSHLNTYAQINGHTHVLYD